MVRTDVDVRIVAAILLSMAGLLHTTRPATAHDPAAPKSSPATQQNDDSEPTAIQPPQDLTWTEVPTVDLADPTLHRGIVYGPDGKPLAGANVYAASTIELFEIRDADQVSATDLGSIRGITDQLGRFEFKTPDLTWTEVTGQTKRWEALLVATKDGFAPGWVKTWGADRGLRSHWHPWQSKKVAIHLSEQSTLSGRFTGPDGNPLAGVGVRLTSLMVPRNRDLDKHVAEEESAALSLFQTIDYQEFLARPWLLHGIPPESTTDDDGRFNLAGLPRGNIVQIQVSHPVAQTTTLRVAVREMESIYRQPFSDQGLPTVSLLGPGFTYELAKGVTLTGRVQSNRISQTPIAGITVAMANHNAPSGMSGEKFTFAARSHLSAYHKSARRPSSVAFRSRNARSKNVRAVSGW